MRSARSFLALTAVGACGVIATSLADLCTTFNVQSALPVNAIEGITLTTSSVTANALYNYSTAGGMGAAAVSGLSFCNVTFSYTRNGVNNQTTNLWYWLPSPETFKGRYLSTGGGGLAITSGQNALAAGVIYGAATGTTDGGFGSWSGQLSNVLLPANGTMNYDMLTNFAYRSIHEMSVIGKALTANFYNASKVYSYYQGCSEGGREGWSQVQRYGTQFDGAVVGAPAFRFAFQQVLHLWSVMVEKTLDYFPPPCELTRINNDTIAACDELDGRKDGVVSRTDLCKLHHQAADSIGNSYACAATAGGGMGAAPGFTNPPSPAVNGTVSTQGAAVADEIVKGMFDTKGRQMYLSFQPSASFADATTQYNNATGTYQGVTSGIGVQWVNLFLKEINSASLDISNATYDTLRAWILQGMQQYADTLETTWPDLEDFHNAGGKVIHYHGESDNSVPTGSSVIYHDAVRRTMYPGVGFNESYDQLHEWYRLFLIPGAGHCAVNSQQPNGPFPTNVLQSLIDWVENDVNPERLNATVTGGTIKDVNQQICSFPLRPLWNADLTMDCVYDQASIDTWFPTFDSIPLPVY